MKARKKSTVCTIALPGGTRDDRRIVRGVEADQHVVALHRVQALQRADSTPAPTLAPQPPQRMAMAESRLLRLVGVERSWPHPARRGDRPASAGTRRTGA